SRDTLLSSLTHPPTPHTSPLSLHDALPILRLAPAGVAAHRSAAHPTGLGGETCRRSLARNANPCPPERRPSLGRRSTHSSGRYRSEEHTSELQSPYDLVCRLLLEKKKNNKT